MVVSCLPQAGIAETSVAVAVVGKALIIAKDISFKIRIEEAYGNHGETEEVALISLINDAIEHEIALIHIVLITKDEIDSFRKYVDENTKAPEILQKVKGVFGDDLLSYERLYLAPKIMNRKLRFFYSTSPEIHKAERALIEKAYSLIRSRTTFEQVAKECGLQSSTFDIEDKETTVYPDLQKYVRQEEKPFNNPLVPIVETLSKGGVYQNIIEAFAKVIK